MSDSTQSELSTETIPGEEQSNRGFYHKYSLAIKSLLLLVVFSVGVGSGFILGRKTAPQVVAEAESPTAEPQEQSTSMMHHINPPGGYEIAAEFGDVGPQMVAAGAIDMTKFISLYEGQNQPLTEEQMTILTKGTNGKVVINPQNAYFLLNFFWALGLVNDNPILTEGPMMSNGPENVGGFASTGGWTIGSKSPTELYSSRQIISLTEEQQARLLEVASGVYRPCCNNPTHFPDCNHGMAMLGLLELMASQGASAEDMFDTAKYVTAFWYPQQMLEVATVFKAAQNVDYADADSRQVVSSQYASGSGFQAVHQWLSQNGLLEEAPSSGGSCGVK